MAHLCTHSAVGGSAALQRQRHQHVEQPSLQQRLPVLRLAAADSGARSRSWLRQQSQHDLQCRHKVGCLPRRQLFEIITLPGAAALWKPQQRGQLRQESSLPEHKLVGGAAPQQGSHELEAVVHHNVAIQQTLLPARQHRPG